MARSKARLLADLEEAKAQGDEDLVKRIEQEIKLKGIPSDVDEAQKFRHSLGSPAEGMNAAQQFLAANVAGAHEVGLGYRQAKDALTGGKDKEALEKEAADQRKLNEPLYETGWAAKAGGFLPKVVADVLAMGTGGRVLRGLGRAAERVAPSVVRAAENAPAAAKFAGAAVKNFGGGAFSGVTTPSENYDFVKQAIQGGATMVPGIIGARTAQHVANPFRNYGPPRGGWPENSPQANLAQRLLDMEGMPGILAENRVVRQGSGGIPGATNAMGQLIVGGGKVRENRAKLREAATENWTQGTGITSPTLGPSFGRALDERGTAQWDNLRTFPDVRLEGMPAELQKALDDVRATPQVAPSLTDITSALDRAIHASSARGPGAAPTRIPSIFGTLDETAAAQPGGGGVPTLRQIIEQASSDLPGGRGRAPGPSLTPTHLWGETGPQGMEPGFTPPGHVPPATGETRFHVPEEPPAPKLPSMTAEEFLRQHSEISRRLRDASLPGGDANLRKLYGALLESMDEQVGKSWSPNQVNEYTRVRAEEGHQRDTEKLKRVSGDTVDPRAAMDILSESHPPGLDLAPRLPLHRRMEALDAQAPVPPVTENRAGMIGVETGAPIVGGITGGGLGHAFGGDVATGLGTVAGVLGIPAASRAMSRFLLGMEGGGRYFTGQNESRVGKGIQSREFADFLERAGLSTANTIGQKYLDDSKEFPYF